MMARKKAEPAPTSAKLVTTYADSVELVSGDDPLTVTDLKALVNAVENELFLDPERTKVTLRSGVLSGFDEETGEYRRSPDTVRVSQVTTSTEVLDG